MQHKNMSFTFIPKVRGIMGFAWSFPDFPGVEVLHDSIR